MKRATRSAVKKLLSNDDRNDTATIQDATSHINTASPHHKNPKMNTVALCSALVRINWPSPSANAFMDASGFESFSDVGIVTRKLLETICKSFRTGRLAIPAEAGNPAVWEIPPIPITYLQQFKLYGMHHWMSEKLRQGVNVVAVDYTADVGAEYTLRAKDMIKKWDDKSEIMVKPPGNYTRETKWIPWYILLKNYLGTAEGKNKVTLLYVIRPNEDIPALGTVFATTHECLVLSTPHSGTAYKQDNITVWALVKQLTLTGPAYAYIGLMRAHVTAET